MNSFNILRFWCIGVVLFSLLACGGTGNSLAVGTAIEAEIETDTITDTDPAIPVSIPLQPGAIQPTQTGLPMLNYPEDFPAQIKGQYLGSAVQVTGLVPLTSYTFSTNPNSTVMAQNYSTGNPVVCFETETCTGTAVTDTVAVIVIGAANGDVSDSAVFSLDINPSSVPAVYYEGTPENPVPIRVGKQLGRVGSTRNDDDYSYYELQELVIGSRYSISIQSLDDDYLKSNLMVTASDGSVLCNPNYSGDTHCQFVATETAIPVSIEGVFALYGEAFDITLSELSSAEEFEGSWLDPLVVPMLTPELSQHLGKVDEYISYYDITGLVEGRRYTIKVHSEINFTTLSTVDPAEGTVIGGICEFVNSWDNTGDWCTFEAAGSVQRIAIKGSVNASSAQYIFSVRPEAPSEGADDAPVPIMYNTVRNGSAAITPSYYLFTDLPVGESVIVTAQALSGRAASVELINDGAAIPCGNGKCEFVPTDDSARLTVTPNEDLVQSTPLLLAAMPIPVNETLTLSAASLPATVQSRDYYSNYVITGLQPNVQYLIGVAEASNRNSLSVVGETILQCHNSSFSTTPRCLADSDASGELSLRVTGDTPGFWATLELQPYAGINAEYLSIDTPLVIPENDVAGVTSSLTVDGSGVASLGYIGITVDIEHGYTTDVSITLIAPDGREVILFDHLAGDSLTGVQFNDYAQYSVSENDDRFQTVLRPQNPLYLLNGLPADGIWQLRVVDDRAANISSAIGGEIARWGLTFGE